MNKSKWRRYYCQMDMSTDQPPDADIPFIPSELQRNQLTAEDLQRIARHHTPLENWPDTPGDLLEAEDAPPPDGE